MLQRFSNQPDISTENPAFRYNIFRFHFSAYFGSQMRHDNSDYPEKCSSYFNDYIFQDMMDPSQDALVQFQALRQDSLELRFFQVGLFLTQLMAD